MQERHVTVDGHQHELARPFVVLATQNPAEYEGTYPLPEAQLDRFMVRVSLGYPSRRTRPRCSPSTPTATASHELGPVADVSTVRAAQAAVAAIEGREALRRYVVAICDATRTDERVELGASPRAVLMLFRAAKALAALEGRDHVLPDDVQALAPSVLAHRLLLALRGGRRSARGGDSRGDQPRPRPLSGRGREAAAPRAPRPPRSAWSSSLVGLGFGLTAALVCGIGLLGLAVGAVGWVELATRAVGSCACRVPAGSRRASRSRFAFGSGGRIVPPPGGELTDPLLERSGPVGPRWSKRLDASRPAAESAAAIQLAPARLVVRDPLGPLAARGWTLPTPLRARRAAADRSGALGRARARSRAGSRRARATRATPSRGGAARAPVRGRRPAALPRRQPRVAHPLAGGRAHRRDDRAAAGRRAASRGRWWSSIRAALRTPTRASARCAPRASLCVELARSGGCDLLLPGARRPLAIDPALRSWPEAHVKIAVSNPERGPAMLPPLTGSAVLWVTAGQGPALRPSAASEPGSFLITPTGSRRGGGLPGLGLLRPIRRRAGAGPRTRLRRAAA